MSNIMPSDECSKNCVELIYTNIIWNVCEALEDLNVLKKLLHSWKLHILNWRIFLLKGL